LRFAVGDLSFLSYQLKTKAFHIFAAICSMYMIHDPH